MKTKHFAIGLLAFVMAVCVGVSFTSRHTNASADEGAALWEEIISGGDFEGLGVEEGTPAVLTSEPGVGGFKGFGLLGTAMGRHGEFVNEDDNTYLKFGAGYGGFTGNDYVLQIPAVTYDRIGLGTYLLSFDIKASETVVAKTFYLRVQGGPAEFKNHYIIPFVAPDAINAEDRAEKWADLTSKMSALENGWYHYEAKYVIDGDADDLAGHTFWLMGGIAGATEDDYYGIDNLSFKRIGGVTEIFPNGDFESQIAEGEESAVLNTAKNGIQGFGASGEFVKDEKGNTYLKLGMDYEGAVVNDNGANTAIQMLGLDFTQLGSGKYVLNLDIKPCGDVGSKTHYFRTMLQPNDKDMVHFSDFPVDTWDKAVWTAGDGSVRAFLTPTTDGWYHFVQYYTITSDRDTYECTMLWLMLGLHDGTKDDYYAIDNISFSRYEEIIEGVIDDGSIEIPEEDQVEIFASLADVLGDDESYRIGNVRNGFGSYNTAGMPWGTVKHLGDDVVLQMGYEEDVTLLNEWGYNITGYVANNFETTGAGYYQLAFDIKANGNVVENTRYLRTFLNPGDKSIAQIIAMGTETPANDWNKSIGNMEDLGDGWYRYTRTIIVSTEKNNIGSDRVVFQFGYAEAAAKQGDWENDYYLLKNIYIYCMSFAFTVTEPKTAISEIKKDKEIDY